MTTPKYRESAAEKVARLALGKPHILWSREFGEWLYHASREEDVRVCSDFCHAQDSRWTPRRKND